MDYFAVLFTGLLSAGSIELFRFDRLTAGSLVLTAIGFIYVGFAGDDSTLLLVNGTQALVIWLLAYGGLRKNPMLIPLGLLLHAGWDLGYNFLVVGTGIPEGYGLFCVVVDLGLAGYFSLVIQSVIKAAPDNHSQ